MSFRSIYSSLPFLFLAATFCFADEIPADIKPLLDKQIEGIKKLSTDQTIIAAVKKYNEAPSSSMTNKNWKKLTLISPEVKQLVKSDIGKYLKSLKTEVITEMFLNGADGGKVAFLSKTSSWNHKGKAKHDVPMKGETWIGPMEIDDSSGAKQIQVGIPILDEDKPIGSLVIGFGVAEMQEQAK